MFWIIKRNYFRMWTAQSKSNASGNINLQADLIAASASLIMHEGFSSVLFFKHSRINLYVWLFSFSTRQIQIGWKCESRSIEPTIINGKPCQLTLYVASIAIQSTIGTFNSLLVEKMTIKLKFS